MTLLGGHGRGSGGGRMSTSKRAPGATAEPAEQARPGVLAGPSSARLPFVPPPALRSAAGVHAALSLWAGTCFDLALHGLAVDLSEAAESVGHREDEPGSRLRHAAYLLHVDRFADALAALPPPSGGLPAAPSDVTFADLLRATAEVALGDDQALGWLTTMSSALMHSDAADLFAACLARVADARGDQHLGDAAHRQLGLLGVVNRAVTPRVAALRVLDRDQDEVDAAQQTLADAVGLLQGCSQSFATDPQPALDSAAELVSRGDRGGAALLLRWVNRLDPAGQRIQDALRPLSPRRPGWGRGLLLATLWLGALAVGAYGIKHQLPAVLLPLAGAVYLWHRYVPLPGMSIADSRLYRRIRPVRPQPLTAGETAAYSILAVVSLALGATGASTTLAAVGARWGMTWEELPLWVVVPVVVAGVGILPGAAGLVAWRLRRRKKAKHADRLRAAEERVIVNGDGRCRCWDTAVLGGGVAGTYLARHLRPLPLPTVLEPVSRARLGALLQVAQCDQTGAAWLRIGLTPEGACYLLRSPLGAGTDLPEDAEAETAVATGFYL
jgi:hypothetical protein